MGLLNKLKRDKKAIPSSLLFISLCLSFHLYAQPLDENSLPADIKVVVDGHDIPSSGIGFLVQEVGTSEPVLSINSTLPFNPASTMKVITTSAGLGILGPAYTWDTKVFGLGAIEGGVLKGDLLIQGGGDPFLVEENFREMLKTLKRRGVDKIEGDLVLDASFFDTSVSTQAMLDNQVSRAYNVLPNAAISNFQAVTFYFYPHTNSRDVVIKAEPPLPNLEINNRLKLRNASCSGYQRGISFAPDIANENRVIFSGEFPSNCKEYIMVRAVLEPSTYTYGLFQLLWAQLGGEFEGGLRVEAAPEGQEPLFTWNSPPLADVIQSINKNSNNLMTRQLLLTLGAEATGVPATVNSGVQVITDYLKAQGINDAELVIENGAGLSRDARVTPDTLNQVLQYSYASELMPEFVSSLPLAGVDGTMRYRLRGDRTAGTMHVKSGSLDEVAAVAGYVYAQSGKVYAVSAMVNYELADRGPGEELLDALLTWVRNQ